MYYVRLSWITLTFRECIRKFVFPSQYVHLVSLFMLIHGLNIPLFPLVCMLIWWNNGRIGVHRRRYFMLLRADVPLQCLLRNRVQGCAPDISRSPRNLLRAAHGDSACPQAPTLQSKEVLPWILVLASRRSPIPWFIWWFYEFIAVRWF